MKLMIVGIEGIGKTSLLEQLRMEGTGTYRKKPPEVSFVIYFHISFTENILNYRFWKLCNLNNFNKLCNNSSHNFYIQ